MPETITFTRTIELNEDHELFIEVIIGGEDNIGDMLIRGFSGYWLCGVKHFKGRGWLCRIDDYENEFDVSEEEVERREQIAIKRVAVGHDPLDEGFYMVDRAKAVEMLKFGLAKWGDAFIDGTCDYGDYDVAVQTVLLGEVDYG